MECVDRRGRGDPAKTGTQDERMASAVFGTNPFVPVSVLGDRSRGGSSYTILSFLFGEGCKRPSDGFGGLDTFDGRSNDVQQHRIRSSHVHATMTSLGCRSKANRNAWGTVRDTGEAMEDVREVVERWLTSDGGILDGSDREGTGRVHEAFGDVQSPVRQRTRVRTP